MRDPKCSVLAVAADGGITMIYDDEFVDLLGEGEARIERVSHVEPGSGGWYADMSPVGGPSLGPFALRQEALDAEVEYLRRRLF